MYKNILVMTDFSEHSNYAVEVACELTAKFSCNLYILHVANVESGFTLLLDDKEYAAIKEKMDKAIEEELIKLPEKIPCLKNVNYTPIHRRGIPYEEGLKEIETGRYDLLVMGSHGKSNVTTFFYGSTTAKLTRRSPISTLTTRLISYHAK